MPDDATREQLGRIAHEAWAAWLREQPSPWPVETVAWEDRHPDAQESYRRIGEAVAAFAAEHCAQAILAHMEAHLPPKAYSSARLEWHRHLSTAARVAAAAFMTDDDLKRAAAEALARGDFAVCPSLDSEAPGA